VMYGECPFQIGDEVIVYRSRPLKCPGFRAVVEKIETRGDVYGQTYWKIAIRARRDFTFGENYRVKAGDTLWFSDYDASLGKVAHVEAIDLLAELDRKERP